MDKNQIRYVHVVYKTHLDIGYTALAQDVLDRYVTEFIPQAMNTAAQANAGGRKNFIWTTGAYLIHYFLSNAAPEQADRMCQAIQRGDIVWHALACTTCTELMDRELMDYDLSISQSLDRRFGKKTIAAKMTDVPGHTKAMIPALSQAGVRYLHIGINGASRASKIPPLCRWRHGGSEIILNYAADYGQEVLYEGCAHALVFAHTRDNIGPPSAEDVAQTIASYRERYPNARIFGSTLDAFAQALLDSGTERMPVLTDELGDSWIYGVGTDPWKVSAYRTLLQLKDQWRQAGVWGTGEHGYGDFMENLLLLAEHTWGMDFKKYLYDYVNWSKPDFCQARQADKTGEEHFLYGDPVVARGILDEHARYTGSQHEGSYRLFERSHQEQRDYILHAVAALPKPLGAQARTALQTLVPLPQQKGHPIEWEQKLLALGDWQIRLSADGSISDVLLPSGRRVDGAAIGVFRYEVFDAQTTAACYTAYNRNDNICGTWARSDFSKPGLERVPALRTQAWAPRVCEVHRLQENCICMRAELDERAHTLYGCPRHIETTYTVWQDRLEATLCWFDKPASRIPEAIWFGFRLPELEEHRLRLQIMGEPIDPWAVAAGGNRKLHCAEQIIYDGEPLLKSTHAPLICTGGPHLYDEDDQYPVLDQGLFYLLYNNRWGTNYKMWYEEDALFHFTLQLPTAVLQGDQERKIDHDKN